MTKFNLVNNQIWLGIRENENNCNLLLTISQLCHNVKPTQAVTAHQNSKLSEPGDSIWTYLRDTLTRKYYDRLKCPTTSISLG